MFLSSCSHVMLRIVSKVHLPWVIKEWRLIFETWFTMCVCGEIVWGSVSVNHTLFEGVKQSMKQEFLFNSMHKNTGVFLFFLSERLHWIWSLTPKVCVSLCICVLTYEFLPDQQTESIAYDRNSVIFKACSCVWSKCTAIKHWETPPRPSPLSLQTQEGRKGK